MSKRLLLMSSTKIKFRLNEFKQIDRWIRSKFPPPIAFILRGYLYGLEDLWIEAKVRSSVDRAIAPVAPPEPVIEPPTYYTEPSEVEGLDIIGLTRTRTEDQE